MFIHALGFAHEHNRPDRDDYITIKWDNIQPGNTKRNFKNFKKMKSSWLTWDLPYDGKSIMHYKYYMFGIERLGSPSTTIESKVSSKYVHIQCL